MIVEGTAAAKWKPGKSMPRPTADQLKHPKRLLFSDLKLLLWHYASKPLHTLVVMGDMNTDLYAERRRGKDCDALLEMMDELKLVSCGQAAWPQPHAGFVTHSGDSVHALSLRLSGDAASSLLRCQRAAVNCTCLTRRGLLMTRVSGR